MAGPDFLLDVGLNLTRLKAELGKINTSFGQQLSPEKITKTGSAIKEITKNQKESTDATKASVLGLTQQTTAQKSSNEIRKNAAKSLKSIRSEERLIGRTRSSSLKKMRVYSKLQDKNIKLTKQQQIRVKALANDYKKLGASAKKAGGSFITTLGKAALWSVAWTAVYGAIRLVTGAIGDVVDDFKRVDAVMARVATVTVSASGDMQKSLAALKSTLLNYVNTHVTSLEAAGEALFKLSTAHLNSAEAAQALTPVMNLVIATTKDLTNQTQHAAEVATLVAGVYNNYKDQLGDTMTVQEKFNYIAGVLFATFKDQRVELKQLGAGLSHIVGVASLAGIKFEELAALIGVLNTGYIESGKAGRQLRIILNQLGGNADKLAAKFGVVTDPDELLQLHNTLVAINSRIREGTMSAGEIKDVFDVFRQRAGQAAAILGRDFTEVGKQIESNKNGIVALEKALKIQTNSMEGQLILLKNAWRQVGREMIGMENMPNLIETLQTIRRMLIGIGYAAAFVKLVWQGWVAVFRTGLNPILAVVKGLQALHAAQTLQFKNAKKYAKEALFFINPLKIRKQLYEDSTKAFENFMKTHKRYSADSKDILKEIADKAEAAKALEEVKALVVQDAEIKKLMIAHRYRMLEIQGASELYVIRQKLANLDKDILDITTKKKERAKLENQLIEKQVERWQQIAEIIRGGVSEGIFGLIKGTQTWQESLVGIGDELLRFQLERITKEVAFKLFPDTAQMKYETAINNNTVAINNLTNTIVAPSSILGGGDGGVFPGRGAMLSSALGGGLLLGGAGGGKKGGKGGALSSGLLQKAFGAFGIGSAAYGAYQTGQQQGPLAGFAGGALSGALAGSIFGPIGAGVGGVIGGIAGLFGGSKQKSSTSAIKEQTQTSRISSRIDITNRELQIVNRNLIGLRNGFEGWALQQSYYLRQRPNNTVNYQPFEFATNLKRGYS